MLKALPLLYMWYRMGAVTRPWAAPGASDDDFRAMRRATKTAFWVMLGFSLLGFTGPALLPSLRHSGAAQTFSTVTVIAGFVLSMVFDLKAELLRRRGRGEKRERIFFPPGWLKKNERFSHGVKKFIAYQRDLMPEAKLTAVLEAREAYETALRRPDKETLDGLEKNVLKVCETAVPEYNASPLKENVEVIVVAIIVALGIRAYYLQPFKIPTSSMQPTLNGIIATPLKGDATAPNFLMQGWEYVWRGRNYVNVQVPENWGEAQLTDYRQYSRANFFTFTELRFNNNDSMTLTAYSPAKQLLGGVLPDGMRELQVGIWRTDNYSIAARSGMGEDTSGWVKLPPQPVKPGEVLARGYVESGDQLLVDKMSYHFRSPRRDEVFVFSTAEIKQIEKNQHYIKRLVALPGDRLAVEPPKLIINGAVTTGPGSGKVMSQQDGYPGYTKPGHNPRGNFVGNGTGPRTDEVTLPDDYYMAMGDNSPDSSDSRNWGPVRQRNLVGPAMFVYWPFAQHWGLIP